jgi:Kef-type K+ transport system membrane component KefB
VLEKGADRIAVGLGMIPRGEVGLIFASIGRTLQLNGQPVINGPTYSAVVLMVVLTTLVTPPLLAARLKKSGPPPR